MNVIHIVISLATGGLERLVVDWTHARNTLQPGSTRICCLDELGALAGQVEGVVCVNAKRARWPFDLAAVRGINQLLSCSVGKLLSEKPAGISISASTTVNHRQPVVLHAHNLAAWQYAVLAKVLGEGALRLIYTQHGANLHNFSLRDRIRARILACFTDEIVAVSDATAKSMSAQLWLPRKKIRVIANGVTPPHPGSLPQGERAGVRGEVLTIGSVGRLAHVKGYDRLITAFADLTTPTLSLNNHATTSLLLVGDGPEREALQRQAHSLGVSDRINFAGYQPDPTPYLARMNLFVLPSRSEGMSVALLEAMAAGVPVAATDAGANREILNDGHCGVILPADEHQWAGLMASSLKDHAATTARVQAAWLRIRDHYSLKTTLDNYERLYAGTGGGVPC